MKNWLKKVGFFSDGFNLKSCTNLILNAQMIGTIQINSEIELRVENFTDSSSLKGRLSSPKTEDLESDAAFCTPLGVSN